MSNLMDETPETVGEFFDSLSSQYDESITRCVPRYDEMLRMLLYYLPDAPQPLRILELGCGTGNLSRLLVVRFPDSEFTLTDVSRDALSVCRRAVGESGKVAFSRADFRDWSFREESFDVVVSSISIHHLNHDEKETLFENVYASLRPGGVFSFSDQFAGATTEIYRRHMQAWRTCAEAAGVAEDEWSQWMDHQERHDNHESLTAQIAMLDQAGFIEIDSPWRHLLWTILLARRPA